VLFTILALQIVNATPLIALALIDRLELLQALFDEVVVPSPPHSPIDSMLTGLDAGEMAVLLLAQQINPDWVLIDERLARRVAFSWGLSVKGTLGILPAYERPRRGILHLSRVVE
jgi:predicted nucleic acid-binding protein